MAIDVSEERLALMAAHGASLTLRADELGFKELQAPSRGFAKEHGIPT